MIINSTNKQSKTKHVLILFMILALVLGTFAACGSSDETTTDEPAQTEEELPQGDLALTISIDFPDSSSLEDVKDKPMALPDGGTVLDLIYNWANENAVELQFDKEDPETQYLQAIGDAKEAKDKGWTFEVDGEMPMTSIGTTALKDGSHIDFKYVSW